MEVMSRLIDGDVHVHTRKICRVKYPHDPYDIVLPHQDFWYIRGAQETYSAWLPLMEMTNRSAGWRRARLSYARAAAASDRGTLPFCGHIRRKRRKV